MRGFDAYPQRQFVTESSYNNSLAYRHIWSTIKTLPATLPEPRSEIRGPSSDFHGPPPSSHGPRTTDRGPRTGVTVGVSLSALDLIIGGGRRTQGLAAQGTGLLDWLAGLMAIVNDLSQVSYSAG